MACRVKLFDKPREAQHEYSPFTFYLQNTVSAPVVKSNVFHAKQPSDFLHSLLSIYVKNS